MTKLHYCTAALLGTISVSFISHAGCLRVEAQSSDPCATIAGAGQPASAFQVSSTQAANVKPEPHRAPGHLDALWLHRANPPRSRALTATNAFSQDVGEIAVMQDAGDLLIKPNRFDLADFGVRLTPNAGGGYDASPIAYGFRLTPGSAHVMGDDDSREDTLRFTFPFFDAVYGSVNINSDGNVTFGEGDKASTERSVTRFLSGPPRIAALFADLDPASGGRVLTSSSAGAYSLTWCGVPEFGSRRLGTVQVTLLPTGVIELQSSARTTIVDAIVGVSPGRTAQFTPVDWSAATTAGAAGAVGERFTATAGLDTIATTTRFLATHTDEFDNVVMFTDAEVLTDGFAYELTIANQIRGLNLDTYDASADWGSAGRLQSLVMMDALTKYPDNPREKVLGESSTVSVLGQEFGHRWLAFFTFRDQTGRASSRLLGREGAHWSFFFDSDGSVMEGNDIEDLGGGSFRTVGATSRYSLLDQYAMGLIDKTQVPPFFYVQDPANVVPPRGNASSPEVGVSFTGTRRDVTIGDVIATAGERVPSAAESARDYRQAFIYITSAGRQIGAGEIAKLDRIRVAWEQFLSAATDSRMRVDTRLASVATSARAPMAR